MRFTKKEVFQFVIQNKTDKLDELLKNGLDIDIVKNAKSDRITLLGEALRRRETSDDTVMFLINKGAKVLSNMIPDAAYRSLEVIKTILIKYKKSLLSSLNEYDFLKETVKEELINIMTDPLNFNANDIMKFAENKLKPTIFYDIIIDYFSDLSMALLTATHSYEITQFLLEHGAKVNFLGGLHNPLVSAVTDGSLETVKLLLKHGANSNEKAIYGGPDFPDYPIEAAVKRNDLTLTKFLLSNGANTHYLDLKQSLLEYAINNHKLFFFDNQVEQTKDSLTIISVLLKNAAPLELMNWEYRFENQPWIQNGSILNLVNSYEVLELFIPYQGLFSQEDKEVYFNKRLKLLVQ